VRRAGAEERDADARLRGLGQFVDGFARAQGSMMRFPSRDEAST
jgi:hypothetical protein